MKTTNPRTVIQGLVGEWWVGLRMCSLQRFAQLAELAELGQLEDLATGRRRIKRVKRRGVSGGAWAIA